MKMECQSNLEEKESTTMFDPNNQNTLPASYPNDPSLSHPPSHTINHSPLPTRHPRSRVLWGCLTFLTLVTLALLLVVKAISVVTTPGYFPPIFLQQLPVPLLLTIGVGPILVIGLVIGIARRQLRQVMGVTGGLALIAFIALGELWAGFINPYVSLTSTGFAISAVEISTGTPFHLQNPADGVRQVLCLGIDQTCQPQDGAPMVLNQGMQVQPGQIVTFSFDTTGTYHITSKVSPGMNLSVDVGEPSD